MTDAVEPKVTAKPPRRRTTIALLSIFGGLALVAGALWGADAWARQQVADYVTDKVQEVLSLDSDKPVTVTVAGFSVLAQLLSGTIEKVDVGVENVTIGELNGDVTLVAEGIPIDLKEPVERVQIEFAVTEESVQSIAHLLSAKAIDDVELVDSEVRFTSRLSIFGFTLDVGAGVEPFAANGEVGFTPTSILLNGTRTDVSDFTAQFGSFADALFTSRSICVAQYLPAALRLDSVVVRDDAFLVITISADKRVFSDEVLSKPGRCHSGGDD
jgi:hypothetical protein